MDHEKIGHCDLHFVWSKAASQWLIITKYDVHPLNTIQDKRQNHWTMKYTGRSQWPTFILRSNVMSDWLIIPKYDIHTSNSLQDIRQNHWTMKERSQWPTFIFRSNVGSYWLINPKYDLQTAFPLPRHQIELSGLDKNDKSDRGVLR